jgi:GNAT superfamily N-acetyltransferase
MEDNPLNIRNLRKTEKDEAVRLFVSAFENSLFYQYIAPDIEERRRFLFANFQQRFEEGFGVNTMDAAVIGAADKRRLVGFAVWQPPAGSFTPPVSVEAKKAEIEKAFSAFSEGLRGRFFAFLETLGNARDKVIRPPFWSLAPIAVLPSEQGKGIASALIRKKLAEIDTARLPCFIATQDEVNLSIYARYGFELARRDVLNPPDIVHYTLIRNAP